MFYDLAYTIRLAQSQISLFFEAAPFGPAAWVGNKTSLSRAGVTALRECHSSCLVADRPGVELGAVSATTALNGDCVAVPRIVADFVQPLAAHGLRRIAPIKVDAAVVSAAMASTIAELSTSMVHLRFVEGVLCSHFVRCRKAKLRCSARLAIYRVPTCAVPNESLASIDRPNVSI